MSEFFNQTVKAGNSALSVEESKLAGLQELLRTPTTPAVPVPERREARLEGCRMFHGALTDQFHSLFGGGETARSAEESYRALRTRLLRIRSAQGLRSVVVSSAVPGEGKTLTSLNLALCCSQLQDLRLLLIDADVRTSGLSHSMGFPAGAGLVDVISGQCRPEEAILATEIPNLYVLSAGSPTTKPTELFAGQRWQEFIGWCNESFKLVLVDSPPVLDLADVELISAACDGVLMVVRAQHAKREVLEKCARQIDANKLLGVVYNGVERGTGGKYPYGYYVANRKNRF